MKLNPDCIRDILLKCEEILSLSSDLAWNPVSLNTFCSYFEYSQEEIAYTLLMLDEACLIDCHIVNFDFGIADIQLYHLTYSGHEFLDAIRSDSVWEKLSDRIKCVGALSLPMLQEVGSQLLLSLISNKF